MGAVYQLDTTLLKRKQWDCEIWEGGYFGWRKMVNRIREDPHPDVKFCLSVSFCTGHWVYEHL